MVRRLRRLANPLLSRLETIRPGNNARGAPLNQEDEKPDCLREAGRIPVHNAFRIYKNRAPNRKFLTALVQPRALRRSSLSIYRLGLIVARPRLRLSSVAERCGPTQQIEYDRKAVLGFFSQVKSPSLPQRGLPPDHRQPLPFCFWIPCFGCEQWYKRELR